MAKPFTDHKGVRIGYNEQGDTWFTDQYDKRAAGLEADTLKNLKKKIDRILSKKFERVSVIMRPDSWSSDLQISTITSVSRSKYGSSYEAWTVDGDGNRKKIGSYNRIFKDTPENRKKLEQFRNLTKEIRRLQSQKEKIEGDMEQIDLKSLAAAEEEDDADNS